MTAEIHDPADSRLDPFRMLPTREASAAGSIVAESELAVARWLGSPHPITALLTTPDRWSRLQELTGPEVEVSLAPIAVVREVVGFRLRRGVVAQGPRPRWPDAPSPRRIVFAEGLSDPRNVGALVRNCRAFAVDELILDPTAGDPYSRRAIRASAGHCFEFPVRVMAAEEAFARHAAAEWIATSPRGSQLLGSAAPPASWVLVVGNEGVGISDALLDRCTTRLRIPLAPGVDSLNVAAATAVCLHALSPALA